MDRLYNPTENGYPGDEDQGGMSSWYVLSALGFYSVCPGTDEYVLGSPKFGKATITLGSKGPAFIWCTADVRSKQASDKDALANARWVNVVANGDNAAAAISTLDARKLQRSTGPGRVVVLSCFPTLFDS